MKKLSVLLVCLMQFQLFAQTNIVFGARLGDDADPKPIDIIDVPVIGVDLANVEVIDANVKDVQTIADSIASLNDISLNVYSQTSLQTLLNNLNILNTYSFYGLTTAQINDIKIKCEMALKQIDNIEVSKNDITNHMNAIQYAMDNDEDWKKIKFLEASLAAQMQWIDVLQSNKVSDINYVKDTSTYKMLSHAYVRSFKYLDKNIIASNLQFAKLHGYDTIHVLFDTKESSDETIALLNTIKQSGFKVCISFAAEDDGTAFNVYDISPELLKNRIQLYAPYADCFILSWKRTSIHYAPMPKEFWNYVCKCIREANNKLPIYGEAYFGIVSVKSANKTKLYLNVPENISGVIIANFGYSDYNIAYIINKLLPSKITNFKTLTRIIQVIGPTAYYCSQNNLNLTLDAEYKIKHDIEQVCSDLNCSTLTIVHDGTEEYSERKYNTFNNILFDLIQK